MCELSTQTYSVDYLRYGFPEISSNSLTLLHQIVVLTDVDSAILLIV